MSEEKAKLNQVRDEAFYKNVVNFRNVKGAAMKHMGIVITDAAPGWARGEIVLEPHHLNPIGSIHGGLIFALADSVGGTAAATRGNAVTTSTGNICFLNAAMGCERLIAEATELKAGRNLLTYDVKVTDDTGKLISKCTMEYFRMSAVKIEDIF